MHVKPDKIFLAGVWYVAEDDPGTIKTEVLHAVSDILHLHIKAQTTLVVFKHPFERMNFRMWDE